MGIKGLGGYLKMKKQAVLIQCHNKPEQINKLISVLPSDVFDVFIHVDKKSSITKDIRTNKNVFLIENRIDVRWGRFSQVEATLAMFNFMEDPSAYSYCHLISGNDFIIKPINWLQHKFCEDNKKEYIESNYLDGSSTWSWGGLDRFQVYYPQWIIKRPANKPMRFCRVIYREFIMRTKIFKRKRLPVEKFYGGSSWWSLTGEMVAWMKEYLENHIEYCDFFKHGVCVDEVFFSTLARYSPYSDRIANNHMRFMCWNEPGNNSGGPSFLKEKDISVMIESEYAFARKFVDLSVIEILCKRLDEGR